MSELSVSPASNVRQPINGDFAVSPDEDWTTIQDTQERKRVQNRLAQRSHRQKVREQLDEYRRLKQQSPSSQHSHLGPGTPFMKQSSSAADGSDGQDIFDFSVGQQNSLGADYFSIPIATPDATSPAPAQTSNIDIVNFGMSQRPPSLDDTASSAPVATLAEPTLPALSDDFIYNLMGTPPSPLPHADIPFSPYDDISNLLAEYNMPSERQQSTGAPFASGPARLDVELKFTDIILSVRSAGFANIDSMALAYYSTAFRRESIPHWIQRNSRNNHLQDFLIRLYHESRKWPQRERQLFRDSIIHIARHMHR